MYNTERIQCELYDKYYLKKTYVERSTYLHIIYIYLALHILLDTCIALADS